MKKKIKSLNDIQTEREIIHQKIELNKFKIIKEIDGIKLDLSKKIISETLKKITLLFSKQKKDV